MKKLIMKNECVNEDTAKAKETVVIKVDPASVDRKSLTNRPKVNTVYVVPNNASKKSILKKLNDPTAEIIDASSFYETSPSLKSKSNKTNKPPYTKVKHKPSKVLVSEEVDINNDQKLDMDHEEEDDSTVIQLDTSTRDFEVTEHEMLEEISHEINDTPEKVDSNYIFEEEEATLEEGMELSEQPSNFVELQSNQGPISGLNVRRNKDAEESIKLAIEDVLKSNMSVKRAAHVYGIRYSVLVSRISKAGSTGKGALGADPALTEKEELVLVDWIRSRYKNGCPVKKIDLINRVADIVSDGRPTRFKDGTPGEKWFMNFMTRNPSVATLGPTTRCDSREAPSKQSLQSWFKRCEDHLQAFGQEHLFNDSRRVGSVEELTLCLLSSKMKVSNSNGSREGTLYLPQEKSGNIMVLLGACADGTLTPPMPVFSCRKPPPALINSITSGWGIGLSKDGNINKEVLHSYFKNILIPWLTEQERLPFILFIDKLKTFLSVDTADFCAQKGLLIYNLYPNSSHVLQPIYKSVLEPVKMSWGALSNHKNDKEALLQFCPTLNQILFDLAPPFTIIDSFRACGIHPFDPRAPDFSKCVLVKGGKQSKNFTSNEYAIALEVFEDMVGKVKTEIFQETLKGFKLLKSEDGPLFKVWHKLVSRVNITRSSSDSEDYKHEKIIRGANRKLPRPEMYLMVVDEGDDNSMQDFHNFNALSQPSSSTRTLINPEEEEADDPSDSPTNAETELEIDTRESIINVFPKSEFAEENEEEAEEEDERGRTEVKDTSCSAFWKEHYTEESGDRTKKERIKAERKLERKIKKERKLELLEQDEIVSKKLKKAIGPRYCTQCLGEKGKLIKCMVCKNYIHFDCMMDEEQQIMSDLYKDHVAFDYICPGCS